MKKTDLDFHKADLRKQAEEKVLASNATEYLSADQTRKVIHELQVHQIELEMQNDELLKTQEQRQKATIELNTTKKKYHDLYNFAPMGYLTLDSNGIVREANQTLIGLLKTDAETLINNSLQRFITASYQDTFFLHRRTLFATRERGECELVLEAVDGSSFWAQFESVLADNPNNSSELCRTVVYDISSRKESEKAQNDLEKQLRFTQKLESLGLMSGGIAHDFNNLLTGILGNAEMISAKSPMDSDLKSRADVIRYSAAKAADLCQQMLAYAGKSKTEIMPCLLNDIVRDVVRLTRPTMPSNVTVSMDLMAHMKMFMADLVQIRQVVVNLVTNAAESYQEGRGLVEVRTGALYCDRAYLDKTYLKEACSEGEYVYCEVLDRGCGMDVATQQKLFDPFFTTKFLGRGLGLAATLGIVRSHGGLIKIDSRPGRGTTIRVLFPATAAALPTKSPIAKADPAWVGSGTVLAIDDDVQVLELVKDILEESGLEVLTSSDSREGVALFTRLDGKIDLVLLDLTMPFMDGSEVFAALHEVSPNVPIVLLSGYGRDETLRRLADKKPAGFISKPFRMDELLIGVRAVLEKGQNSV